MQPLAVIFWITVVLVQLAAAGSGLAHLFEVHLFFGYMLAVLLIAVFAPAVTLAGLYGAVSAWDWHWLWAIALFFPAGVAMMVALGPMTLLHFWTFRRERQRPSATGGREDTSRRERESPSAVERHAETVAVSAEGEGSTSAVWLLVPGGFSRPWWLLPFSS